jgi:hypothetical protein
MERNDVSEEYKRARSEVQNQHVILTTPLKSF